MVTPKRPGIYVTETLTPLTTTASTPSNSTAAFVGTNIQGGPLLPTLVTTWAQYQSIYGGFGNGSDLLPFAVYQYFNNGGGGCYVVRAALANAVAASHTFEDGEGSPENVLTVTASSPGTWGNSLSVTVTPSATAGRFSLEIDFGNTQERFLDITLDPSDPKYAINIVNSPYSGSKYVDLTYAGSTPWTSVNTPATATSTLSSGTDGTGSVNLVTAAQQLDTVAGNFDVNCPGVHDSSTINGLITWAESVGNVFLVVDGVQGASNDTRAANAASQEALVNGGGAFTASSTIALYAPWLLVDDPANSVPGATRELPPGGAVLGKYARNDVVNGVQRAPAGVDTNLSGLIDVKYRYAATDLDTLNGLGVNIIKPVPGAGFCIWGARTLETGTPDLYVNFRRALIYIKQGLVNATQFAIFEDNDSVLWQNIEDILNQYLRTLWSDGVLSGATPDQAWFVVCDDTNNTPSSAQSGVVNIQVGVAVASPAEFIVINIGQTVSGADVTES